MKRIIVLLSAALSCAAANTLTTDEAADGWLLLFDGESTFGWTAEGGGQWKVADGVLLAEAGEYGWLRHNTEFADFELRLQFRTAADGNSGVFIRASRDGQPHLTGYEVQIFDAHAHYPTGSLVGHAAAKGGAIKPGEWQTMEITANGANFVVKLDGKTLLNARDGKSRAGHIGLQYNKGSKIEFRDIRLKPLGLKPLITGDSLKGWRKVEPPKPPKEPAEWSARGGMIHVEKGPGQLETEGTWADFLLQMDIRTNPKDATHHPNSGVFFRGTPNTWWSGYESQIRNEYAEGDRMKPVDFGTGGVYRNQPTRKVVANDGEFFTKTIVARGRRVAVWVNGYQVTDWEDNNPEGANVRNKEAVVKAGAISLQAHDPTTNLDFRNIRIAELPGRK
jgi:hypothetical protein